MSEVIDNYLKACHEVNKLPELEIILFIEEQFNIQPNEASYPAISLDQEIQIYEKFPEKAEEKRIIELLEQAKRTMTIDESALKSLNCERISQIEQSLANDIMTELEKEFSSFGGDLLLLDLRRPLQLLSGELLRQNELTKRVKTLYAAQEAAESLFEMFGRRFSVARGILVAEDYQQELSGLSDEMQPYEDRVIGILQQQLPEIQTLSDFKVASRAAGMCRRKSVQGRLQQYSAAVLGAFGRATFELHDGSVAQQLLELSRYRADLQVAFSFVQMLYGSSDGFGDIEAHCKQLLAAIGSSRDQIVEAACKQIQQLLASYQPGPLIKLEENKFVSTIAEELESVYEIVISIERHGLKIDCDAENEQIKQILVVQESFEQIEAASSYYNLFEYQKQYIEDIYAQQYIILKRELEKIAEASCFDFKNANIIAKAGKYIEQVKQRFDTEFLQPALEFDGKLLAELRDLEELSLMQKELWKQKIAAIKKVIDQFCKEFDEEQEEVINNYAGKVVEEIIAKKYQLYVNNYIFSSLKIKAQSSLMFDENQEELIQEQIQQFKAYIGAIDAECILQSRNYEQFVEEFSSDFNYMQEKIKGTVSAIFDIQQYFLDKYGEIVELFNSKSNASFAEFCSSVEEAEDLYKQGNTFSMSALDEIYQEFEYLTVINENSGLFKFEDIEIDLSDLIKTVNEVPMMKQQIAISASAYLATKKSHVLLQEVQLFSQRTETTSSQISNSEELAELKKYLEQSKERVVCELNDIYVDIQAYKNLLLYNSQQEDACIRMLDMCGEQYLLLRQNVEETQQLIQEKKEQIGSRLEDDAELLAEECGKVIADYLEQIGVIQQYFKQCEEVKKEMVEPVLLSAEASDSSIFAMNLKKMDEISQRIESIVEELESSKEEMKLLFSKSYEDLLSPDELRATKQLLAMKLSISEIKAGVQNCLPIFKVIDELGEEDWPSFKTRFDLLEQLKELSQDNIANLQKINGNGQKPIEAFVTEVVAFLEFINSYSEYLVSSINMLKTPVLTREHWIEIIEQFKLEGYIKLYSNNNTFMSTLPDSIHGLSMLHFLLTMNEGEFNSFQKICREIITRAENEESVRNAVDEVQFYLQTDAKVEQQYIELSDYSMQELDEVGKIQKLPTIAAWKQVLLQLSEKKQVLQSVESSQYATFLLPQINEQFATIEAITEFALLEEQVGKQISILEPVISRKVLPGEIKRFYNACKVIASIYVDEEDAPLILTLLRQNVEQSIQLEPISPFEELGNFRFIVQQLEAAGQLMSQVQTALRIYLEEKRLIFPRFYFLADSDVLELLASASTNFQLVNKHCKKMFSAAEKLDIDNNKIKGFFSTEGEHVLLSDAVTIEGNPEIWLGQLDSSIKETLKRELLECLLIFDKIREPKKVGNSYLALKQASPYESSDLFFSQQDYLKAIQSEFDITKYSGEILTVAFAVMTTSQVESALGSKDASHELEKLGAQLEKYLKVFTDRLYEPQVSQASYGTEDYVLQLKLRLLATDVTHYLSFVCDLGASGNRSWLWNRELKYCVHRQSGDLYLVSLDTFLPYTFEYEGLPARLIQTPLTDRCYATLVTSLHCQSSSQLQGYAGSGKTESVKAFAAKLARPCIVFNCDSAIDRENLGRILIGIVLSGSVGCFDEVNRLSPAVLSAVSTDIEAVQKAIYYRSTSQQLDDSLTLADISVPVAKISPFSAVFVTMNPASREYRGRSEIPFSLRKLMRPCIMNKADTVLIMQTNLATSGFVHSAAWAKKADLAYALASRRIPKDVSLDWGLRSLQAVLREAALARAAQKGITRDNALELERAIIIKALSDSTYSRIQGASRQLFTEILQDVFGQFSPEKSKFGATNYLEEELAAKIDANERLGNLAMQLFRALTAKTGVALLGKAASGKTKLFNILKKAVFEASNGFIEMREILISPLSMSRSELLGYVDPQTKEWNEGALSRAARTAVELVNNTTKPFIWPIILQDGPVEPSIVESLNNSLDDTRILSLASGERIRFPMTINPLEAYFSNCVIENRDGGQNQRINIRVPTPVSFLFETDSLEHASPATVSRLAIILVADPDVEEEMSNVKQMNEILEKGLRQLNPPVENIAVIAKHLDMAGNGEVERKNAYESGVLSALYNYYENMKPDELQSIALAMNYKILQNDCLSPHICEGTKYPKEETWAIEEIKMYLASSSPIILKGDSETGKYYCLEQAIDTELDDLITIPCTTLTNREGIIKELEQECVEIQRGDGQKVIKSKTSGKKIILFIRNADIVKTDEFNNSEIFELIWSIVAHNKIYIKGGIDCLLQDIRLVISIENYDLVPKRIKRLMAVVTFENFEDSDYEYLIANNHQLYCTLLKEGNLEKWLEQEVSKAEIDYSKASELEMKYFISLPNFLKLCDKIPIFEVAKLSELKVDPIKFSCLLQYLYCSSIPYEEGQKFAENDVEEVTKEQLLFPSFFNKNTISVLTKLATQGIEMNYDIEMSLIELEEKLSIVRQLSENMGESYPFLLNYQALLSKLDEQQRHRIMYKLSAIELSIYLFKGVIIYSEPHNLSYESMVVALLESGYYIHNCGADKLLSSTLKEILDKVARGYRKIGLVIDQSTIEADDQWVQLASALASHNEEYFTTILNMADIRSLSSLYEEKEEISESVSEGEVIAQFFSLVINSIIPVVIINPEHELADQLLFNAPPLRRTYMIVGYPISTSSNDFMLESAEFSCINKDIEKEFIKEFNSLFVRYFELNEIAGKEVPKNYYLRALIIQQHYETAWEKEIKQHRTKLQSGLRELKAAQNEVDTLAEQATQRKVQVECAQEDANNALREITQKMQIVEENKEKSGEMEIELEENEKQAKIQFDEANKELSTVEPLLDEASVAVSSIPNDALTEVKSFKSPPPAVATVLEAVLEFMGESDTSWGGMRSFLSQTGVLRKIAGLNVQEVPSASLKKVIEIVKSNPDCFVEDKIYRVSRAAAPLALWVTASLQYAEVYVKVEPLMNKAKSAEQELKVLVDQLKISENVISQLENETEVLKENFEEKTKDLLRYQKELKEIELKKSRGDEMLSSLKEERIRWQENEEQAGKEQEGILKASILASCMYVCAGNRTDDVRENFVGPAQRRFIESLMISPLFKDEAASKKLRLSDEALENASLIEELKSSIGILAFVLQHVTDSTGALAWLQSTIKAQTVSAQSENLVNAVAIAARFGQPIIVTDCDNGAIPPAVIPYIRYGAVTYQKSENSSIEENNEKSNFSLISPQCTLMVPSTSSKSTECNSKFKIYLVSSVEIEIPTDLEQSIVELSFAPTEKSRSDYYIDEILKQWSPDTLTQIEKLNEDEAKLRSALLKVETSLLDALEESANAPNILEDDNLMKVLKAANIESEEIKATEEKSLVLKKELDDKKEKAEYIADVVGKSMFALEAINNLNELYVVDDSSIIHLLVQVLKANNNPQFDLKISQKTVKEYLSLLYTRLENMVFSQDIIGAHSILLKYVYPKVFTQEIFDYITGKEEKSISVPVPQFAVGQEKQYMEFAALLGDNYSESKFEDASWASFAQEVKQWKELKFSTFPQLASKLNILQKALFISFIRPDLLSDCLEFICQEAFEVLTQRTEDPLLQGLELASGITEPIIIYTVSGEDPTASFDSKIIAISPGKEEEADKLLVKYLDNAGKVIESKKQTIIVIKGAHLCLSWLEELPSKIGEYNISFSAKYDTSYSSFIRIILLLEPKSGFPKNLSRISWRIHLQSEINIKTSIIELLQEINQPKHENLSAIYYCLMYSLCVLHSIMEARKQYFPRGVATDLGWNSQDLLVLSQIISQAIDENISEQELFLRIKGLLNDAIYGVETLDKCDLGLVAAFANMIFNSSYEKIITQESSLKCSNIEETLQLFKNTEFTKQLDVFPFIKYILPPVALCEVGKHDEIVQQLIEYIELSIPTTETADLLALPSNALLAKGEKDSLIVKSILERTGNLSIENIENQGFYEPVLELIKYFDEIENTLEAKPKITNTPIGEEMLQEILSIEEIGRMIKKDLDIARYGANNPLLAPPRAKEIALYIGQNITPEHWTNGFECPPTSVAPLDSPDLVLLRNGSPMEYMQLLPKAFSACIASAEGKLELSLIPRPPALLEAVRREFAKELDLELDNIELKAKLGEGKIQIESNQVVVEGAQLENSELNYNYNSGNVTTIALEEGESAEGIPLYVDKSREIRMPVIEVVENEESEEEITIFGVYMHLVGR